LLVVVVVVCVASRSVRTFGTSVGVLLLVFAIVNVGILIERGIGLTPLPNATASSVSVLSWNTQGAKPGARVIADLAVKSNANVISLPETTEDVGVDVATAMRAKGRPMWVHTIAYDLDFHARSTTLLISASLGDYHVVSGGQSHSTGNTVVLPTVVAQPSSGTGPTIVSVHAVSPTAGEMANWRLDLKWLAGQCADQNVIMAGDFNATVDHLWGLGTSASTTLGNCADAAARAGHGGVGTWPTTLPPLLGTPIDHVMATPNWKVDGMRVIDSHDTAGTMHRPILVRLSPAG
jgi:endonuclease/exonuclease/phosphatase (EEP) superfamily protein YafD